MTGINMNKYGGLAQLKTEGACYIKGKVVTKEQYDAYLLANPELKSKRYSLLWEEEGERSKGLRYWSAVHEVGEVIKGIVKESDGAVTRCAMLADIAHEILKDEM
jgi:hypothetical protein